MNLLALLLPAPARATPPAATAATPAAATPFPDVLPEAQEEPLAQPLLAAPNAPPENAEAIAPAPDLPPAADPAAGLALMPPLPAAPEQALPQVAAASPPPWPPDAVHAAPRAADEVPPPAATPVALALAQAPAREWTRTPEPAATAAPPAELASALATSMGPASGRAPAPAAPPIPVPPSHPRFTEELAMRVAWSARQDLGEVEIQLHPPELGPLRLLLRMEGAELAVQFSAPHAATREALEQGLPRLRELLHAHGLALVQAQVSDQQQRARREPAFGNRPAEPVPEPVVEARALQLKRLGLLDEYA